MGTFKGGSAAYFASLFDLLGHGRIITVDTENLADRPQHPRITYLTGYSTSDEITAQIRNLLNPGEKVMVILDSDHSRANVARELQVYSPMVTPGQYLVVEGPRIYTITPLTPAPQRDRLRRFRLFWPPPADFAPDKTREKFMMTFNPSGWLKRR